MFKYRNTVTGAEIEINSRLSGGNWEKVNAPQKAEKAAKKDVKEEKEKDEQ